MKNVLLGCIALFLMCCQQEDKKDKVTAIESDSVKLPLEYAIIIPDSSQLKYQFTDYLKPINLSEQGLKHIEKIIAEAHVEESRKGESVTIKPSHLYLWKRQYIPYLNKHGEKFVWVNAFRHAPKRMIENASGEITLEEWNWKNGNKIIQADNGGSCFWNILINLNTGESELIFNGEA